MTDVNDFDQLLRQALHEAADSVEPAPDALERIRERMRRPWLARQVTLLWNDCVDLVQLIAIRLEPATTKARAAVARAYKAAVKALSEAAERVSVRLPAVAALATRLGALATRVAALATRVGALAARFIPAHRHGAAHRQQGLRSVLAWLRPALAVATAVFIVVAGVYGLAQLRETLVLTLFPGGTQNSPAHQQTAHGHHRVTAPGSSGPGGAISTSGPVSSDHSSPEASCTPTPDKDASPSPSPSATPTSTPTGSPTPTTSPSPTVSATTTPSVPAGPAAVTGAAPSVQALLISQVKAVTATAKCTS